MNRRLCFAFSALTTLTALAAFAVGCAAPPSETGESHADLTASTPRPLLCLIPEGSPSPGHGDVWTFDETTGTVGRARAFYDWDDVIFVDPASASWSITFHKDWGGWDLYVGSRSSGDPAAVAAGIQLVLDKDPRSTSSSVSLTANDGSQTAVGFKRYVDCPRQPANP